MSNTILVIARYMEDLEWLQTENFKEYSYIVYNKGTNSDYCKTDKFLKEITLPNVGREAHTYLFHIIENYDNLNDMTIFLPGSMNLHHKTVKGNALIQQLKQTPSTTVYVCDKELSNTSVLHAHMFLELNKYSSSNEPNSSENNHSDMYPCLFRPFGFWYLYYFNKYIPNAYTTYNSIFSLSRQTILDKPKDYYCKLITQVNKHHNHEVGHYFERAWYMIFYSPTIPTVQVYTSFKD
jgi:hypothetical protein